MLTVSKQSRLHGLGHAVRMDRRWWNFQGYFVWRASAGKVSHRQTAFALQRRLHEGSEGHGELTPIPGKPRSRERTAWRQTVQKSLSQYEGSLSQRDETETENEGPKPGRQTSVKLSLHPVWERLSLPHDQSDQEVVGSWSDQSHTMLYESPNFHPESAVYQD